MPQAGSGQPHLPAVDRSMLGGAVENDCSEELHKLCGSAQPAGEAWVIQEEGKRRVWMEEARFLGAAWGWGMVKEGGLNV